MNKYFQSAGFNLLVFSSFALILLGYRMHEADNLKFIFLAWNLFLAWVPYVATLGLSASSRRYLIPLRLLLWLLFLPNAPYLITDMLHLHPRTDSPYWIDTFILFVFSLIGILLFYASSKAVWNYLQEIRPTLAYWVLPISFVLCGYGIYMGRWLRYNSWDAFQHPFRMSRFLLNHTFEPNNMLLIGQVTVLFGTMLLLLYRTLQSFR